MSNLTIKDPYKEMTGKFIMCCGCDKPLIERLPNGLWRFKFGRPRMTDDTGRPLKQDGAVVFHNVQAPVFIYIHGSIRIKCFRGKCNAWNTLNFLPVEESFDSIVRDKKHI